MANVQYFDSLSIIMVDFDLWTGQTRLSANDFKLGAGGQLPPEKLTQLGSKKVIDPDHLKGFAALKTQATRLLLRHGMRFMNGYAVPVDKTTELCERLDAIGVEFEKHKQALLSDYNNVIEEWINEHPDHEQMIREGALTAREVEKRIGFEYQVFMIQPMGDHEEVTKSLNRKIGSLGDDLIDEVTKTATDFFNKRFLGQSRVRTTTRQTLMNLRDKIDGLSFLNGAFVPLVGLLNQTLDVYSKHASGGVVEAPHFYQIMAVVSILKSADSIYAYANGQVQVDSVADELRDKAVPGFGVATAEVNDVLQAQQSQSSITLSAPSTVVDTQPETQQAAHALQASSIEPEVRDTAEDVYEDIDRFFNERSVETHSQPTAITTSDHTTDEVNQSAQPTMETEVGVKADVHSEEAGSQESTSVTPDPSFFESMEAEESLFF